MIDPKVKNHIAERRIHAEERRAYERAKRTERTHRIHRADSKCCFSRLACKIYECAEKIFHSIAASIKKIRHFMRML